MVELDAGITAQLALGQQRVALSVIKHTADVEKQLADVIAQTVTASNNGKNVDLYA